MSRKSRKNTSFENTIVPSRPLYRVGLYVRLSVEDIRKKESDSIGVQIALLRQYVNERTDMVEVGIYEDVDKTGTNFNRPSFNKLLDDVRSKKINCIVVKDLSRFGRNHIETGNYLERVFPFMGVRFVAICDDYDSISPLSETIVIPLKNLVNEIYAKDISKKIRSQFDMKRQKGDFCGSFAPYGYIKKGNVLVVDDVAAKVVTHIFRLVLEGYSDNAITALLNNDGILPPSRHRFEQGILKGEKHGKVKYWYKSVVKRITENTAYLGRLEQGRYKTDLMNGGVRISLPKDNWIVSFNTHDAIIDEEMFKMVQEIRKNRRQKYYLQAKEANRPSSSENVLKGYIFCGDCLRNLSRHKIVRANGNLDYRYLCPTYEEVNKNKCTKKNLLESEILTILNAFIETQVKTLADIRDIINEYSEQANYINSMELIDDYIAKTKSALVRVTNFKNSLYEDYKYGILSKDDYKLAKEKYESQLNELTTQLETLTLQKNQHNNILSQNKWGVAIGAFSISTEKKLSHELLKRIIERIDVSKTNDVTITVKYRDEYEVLLKMFSDYANGGVTV